MSHDWHDSPNHRFRHVHVQFPAVPDTFVAWLLQSVASVHVRTQLGYPSYPAMHSPQSFAWFTSDGHRLQVAPYHSFRQVQFQPCTMFPATATAWLLQLLAFVHVR